MNIKNIYLIFNLNLLLYNIEKSKILYSLLYNTQNALLSKILYLKI